MQGGMIMPQGRFARLMSTLMAIALLSASTIAGAITPTVAWQRPGGGGGVFSADGTAVLVTTASGFELDQVSDGALLARLTLPASSLGYTSSGFSADKRLLALAVESDAVRRIELLSDGGLATKQGPYISNSDCKVSFSPN